MKFNKELVDYYADLLLIGLTDEENSLVLDEFNVVNKNMEYINSIPNIEKEEEYTHAIMDNYIDLEDYESINNLSYEDILKNAKEHNNREVIIPKVVG